MVFYLVMCILWFIVCIVQVIIAFIAWVIWHVIRKVVESNCDQIGDRCECHDTEKDAPITGTGISGFVKGAHMNPGLFDQ